LVEGKVIFEVKVLEARPAIFEAQALIYSRGRDKNGLAGECLAVRRRNKRIHHLEGAEGKELRVFEVPENR